MVLLLKDHYDVVIVGAGFQGLAAAHTFLSLNPSGSLLVIDKHATVGGTWCKERIYPGLRANNKQGYFEFTDFPILEQDLGVVKRGLLPGEVIHEYFTKFAKEFGILPKVCFETSVVAATANEDESDTLNAWKLELEDVAGTSEKASRSTTCSKLIVATGQTSRPFSPSYPSSKSFKGPVLHTEALAAEGMPLLKQPEITHIAVIGSGKAAHDAVYHFAEAGIKVSWVIRKSSRGGKAWVADSFPKLGPARPFLEGLLMTRPLSWMGAAPWSKGDGFGFARWMLHGTAPGRFVVRNFFAQLSSDTVSQNGLLTLDDNGKKALKPDETLQWYGGQASVLNYDKNFYSVVRDRDVEIIHEDILDLSTSGLVLAGNRSLPVDAIIFATGYKIDASFPLLPVSDQLSWGFPVDPADDKLYSNLENEADVELFKTYPELLNSPTAPPKYTDMTPWRLWRFIAPPSQVTSGARTLAFLNTQETYENILKAEIASLWAYAYLDGKLAVDPGTEDEVRYEAVLWSRFGRWSRPLGKQGRTADMLFDALPYYDRLLLDLGLSNWRKGWGIFGEIFGGWYEIKDYKGIKEEWAALAQRT